MRVLFVHNRYQQPGGEDVVFSLEAGLLRERGHDVVEYTEDNRRIEAMNPALLAANTIWSRSSRARLLEMLRDNPFDVVHCHNTFPLISPSVYSACQEAGVPVVQSLHNHRLVCPNAQLFRGGTICERCVGKTLPWPSLWFNCYRGSRRATAVTMLMLTFHNALRTWTRKVDAFVALSNFGRRKFIEGGLPEDRIFVKPNFVHPDPGPPSSDGDYVLFAGRLSEEKGLRTLLEAWTLLGNIHLRIVGDGPLSGTLREIIEREHLTSVEMTGRMTRQQVISLMTEARCLVFPSECYEGFPVAIAEAFACGLPVVASRLGTLAEIVEHGRTGLHFTAGNAEELAQQVGRLWDGRRLRGDMSFEARREFKLRYCADENYRQLMDIYDQARKRTVGHRVSTWIF